MSLEAVDDDEVPYVCDICGEDIDPETFMRDVAEWVVNLGFEAPTPQMIDVKPDGSLFTASWITEDDDEDEWLRARGHRRAHRRCFEANPPADVKVVQNATEPLELDLSSEAIRVALDKLDWLEIARRVSRILELEKQSSPSMVYVVDTVFEEIKLALP